ncbi:MAG: hypothetical protein ABH821_05120 [archaeon]
MEYEEILDYLQRLFNEEKNLRNRVFLEQAISSLKSYTPTENKKFRF